MKKNAKTLLILAIVLVVCIGAYIGVSLYNTNAAEKEAVESADIQIYPADFDVPETLSYEADGTTLSFTREDTTWYYDGDRDFPLKQSSVSYVSSTLQSLTAVRAFDAPDDLSAYGLDTPSYTVTAADSTGNTLTLLIGIMNASNYYAMISGTDEVYTIESTLISYLKPDILDMITLDSIPSLSESTIDTISLTSANSTLNLDKYEERDGTYTWFVVDGTTYTSTEDYTLSDGSQSAAVYVTNLVSSLDGMSFSSCASYNPDEDELETYGLHEPGLTVTVGYTTTDSAYNETSESVILEIGEMLADESGYYARLADSVEINVLSVDNVSPLIKALDAMVSTS